MMSLHANFHHHWIMKSHCKEVPFWISSQMGGVYVSLITDDTIKVAVGKKVRFWRRRAGSKYSLYNGVRS